MKGPLEKCVAPILILVDFRHTQKIRLKKEPRLENVRIRVNRAGCLSRCDFGPVIVIYPEGTWYTYLDEEDIDEIIQSHLIKGVLVERLRIKG